MLNGETMFKFGEELLVTAILKRRSKTIKNPPYYAPLIEKYWEAKTISPRKGLFLGTRTLAKGRREFNHDEGYSFKPTSHCKAALIIFSERENPVYAPLDALKKIEK